MIPKGAIERAIEGGWESKCPNCQEGWLGHKQTRIGNRYCTTGPDQYRTALDPTFWQALGKALGWHPFEEWRWKATRFFDLILTGGDTEKFWNKLLS